MAPTDSVRRAATYDDLLALPVHVVGEIIDGELHVTRHGEPRLALARSALSGEPRPGLRAEHGGRAQWWILQLPELRFRGDLLVPELAGWRRARMPVLPETAPFTLPPDWICEVLSPATARTDRLEKLRIYAREGVRHAWLIDPIARTLEVLRLENARWSIVVVHGGDERVSVEPFAEVEIQLASLWPD